MAIETPQTTQDTPEAKPSTRVTVERLFRYSDWVHVGEGADGCEHVDVAAGTNTCTDDGHFHAWCRLPNPLQQEQIQEKALAAKGRRARMLRDPQTDAHDALEGQLDLVAGAGDSAKDAIIAEISERDRWADLLRATGEVMALEDGVDDDDEPVRPWAQIREDQVRYDELLELTDEQREDVRDEFVSLKSHLARYGEAVQKRHEEIRRPKIEALEALDVSALVDQLRAHRITRESNLAFANTYSRTVWLWCTLQQPHGAPVFTEMADMDRAAPEVIEALSRTFDEIERAQGEVASGN